MAGRLHALLDESGEQRKINRAEFQVREIQYLVNSCVLRVILGRPRSKAPGVYPLRTGQFVSFDDWMVTIRISAVGEGYVEIDDFDFAQGVWWSMPKAKQQPRVMIRQAGLKVG